jgi:hypothetical protein
MSSNLIRLMRDARAKPRFLARHRATHDSTRFTKIGAKVRKWRVFSPVIGSPVCGTGEAPSVPPSPGLLHMRPPPKRPRPEFPRMRSGPPRSGPSLCCPSSGAVYRPLKANCGPESGSALITQTIEPRSFEGSGSGSQWLGAFSPRWSDSRTPGSHCFLGSHLAPSAI